jgi:hypothetical protein
MDRILRELQTASREVLWHGAILREVLGWLTVQMAWEVEGKRWNVEGRKKLHYKL